MVNIFRFLFCTSAAVAFALPETDIVNALLEDGLCEGDCSVKLLQIKGTVEEEEVCLEWKQCPDNSEYYLGKKCNDQQLVCTRYGKPQKRQCLKWVNCKNSCYCAQWAKLLEESAETADVERLGVAVPEVTADEIVEVETQTDKAASAVG